MSISIESAELRVAVNPRVGGTITGITHLKTGLSVLGEVPWDAVNAPIASLAARDETEWLTRYTGGWPLLFPNGGDACEVDGVFHGFHGEASIAPWRAESSGNALRLTRRFFTVPVEMQRDLAVAGDVLRIHETLRMTGPRPIDVMWCQHATFGSELLHGDVEITTSAAQVTADADYNPPANPLLPGAAGHWPHLAGKLQPLDLRLPRSPQASLAYLHGFDRAWAAIRRLDNAIAVRLSWDAKRFPCAWLWHELGGTPEAPWHGRARLIGIEPSTTMPGLGLATAKNRGGRLLRLKPGEELNTELQLRVFTPDGPVLTAE